MKAAFRIWVTLVFAAAIAQVAFAGYGAFYAADKVTDSTIDEKTFEDGFGLHAGVGYLVVLMGLILLIVALIARPGGNALKQSGIVFGLIIVQVLLAWFGSEIPAIGALHPVNAFIIVGLLGAMTAHQWRANKMTMTSEPAAAPPPAA